MSLFELLIKVIGIVLAVVGLAILLSVVGISIFGITVGSNILVSLILGVIFLGAGIYIIRGGNFTL